MLQELGQAEQELEKPSPSASRLRQIGQAIKRLVGAVLHYCAGLGDAFLQAMAKEAGTVTGRWGSRALIVYFAAHSVDLQSLAKALMQLAGR